MGDQDKAENMYGDGELPGDADLAASDQEGADVTDDGALSPGSTATGSPTAPADEEETDKDRSERHD